MGSGGVTLPVSLSMSLAPCHSPRVTLHPAFPLSNRPAQRPYGGAARTAWAVAVRGPARNIRQNLAFDRDKIDVPRRAKTGGSTCSGPGSGTGTAAVPIAWRAYAEGAHTLGLALQSMDPGFDSCMVALLVLARDVHCM